MSARSGPPVTDVGRVHAVRLRPATATALTLASLVGLVAFCWPLVLTPDAGLEHETDAPLVLALVLVAVVAVVAVALSDGSLDVKAVALLGLLAAVGSVLRPLSAGTAGVELVFVVLVLAARALGPGFGFALGATTIFASALLTGGVGPWLPFQMLAAAWVATGAGLLPRRLTGRTEVVVLAAYGAVAGLAYGFAMNLSFWPFRLGGATALSYVPGAPLGENLEAFWLFTLTTSLGWDVGRALTTAVAVLLLGRPVLRTLGRTAARASFHRSGSSTPLPPSPGGSVGDVAGYRLDADPLGGPDRTRPADTPGATRAANG